MTFALASSSQIDNWPIFVLLISVAWVVFGITKLKLHPFLSLMIGAILVGWMTPSLPEPTDVNKGLFQSRVALAEAFVLEENNQTNELEILYRGEQLSREETSAKLAELKKKHGQKLTLSFRVVGSKNLDFDSPQIQEVLSEAEDLNASKVTFEAYEENATASNETLKAINWTLHGFGDLVGGLGLLIAMAAIIGTCMMLSGAADRVVALADECLWRKTGWPGPAPEWFLSIHPRLFRYRILLLIPLARASLSGRASIIPFTSWRWRERAPSRTPSFLLRPVPCLLPRNWISSLALP